MSYFFRLKDQIYKAGNKVTIGRGAPFDDLCLDRDVLRAHCQLQRKKEKFYIKSLGPESNTCINDKKILPKKWVQVGIGDKVLLGEQPLEILKDYTEKDYISLISFYSPLQKYSNFSFWQKGLLASSFVLVLLLMARGASSVGDVVASILISVGIGLFCATIWHLQAKLGGTNDELMVNEVVIGKTGLTLHYKNTNMSIEFANIKHAYLKHKVIFIHAYDEKFLIQRLKDTAGLFETILKEVPLSARSQPVKDKKEIYYPTLLISSLVLANIYLFVFNKGLGQEALMISISSLILLSVSLLFQQSPFDSIKNSKNAKSLKKRSFMLGMFVLIVGFTSFSEYKDLTEQEIKLSQCLSTAADVCKDIDYGVLVAEFGQESEETTKLINSICGVDEVTCVKLKQAYPTRSIASETK